MDMSKYRDLFLSETKEHLSHMSRILIELEKNPHNRAEADALFREAHSIKGMAASMGFTRTAELAHALEDLMDGFRKAGDVPPEAVDRMLLGMDLLEALVEDITAERPEREIASFMQSGARTPTDGSASCAVPIAAPEKTEKPPEAAAQKKASFKLSIRISEQTPAPAARAMLILRELRETCTIQTCKPEEASLMQGGPVAGLEMWVQSALDPDEVQALVSGFVDVAEVSVQLDRRKEPQAAPRGEAAQRTLRVRTELLDQFVNLTGELITRRNMLRSASRQQDWTLVNEGLAQLSRLVSDLHHHVLQVRMMPLESITGRLPRMVRDLCRKTGKDVELHIEGEEVELDRTIVEELADPLMHIVRNAVDHGIASRGRVSVRAWREKDLAILEVADDGRGIDPEAIRARIIARNLLGAAQAKALRERELLQWICRPGFSTAVEVTETSGRGVGMDVVKSSVDALGGVLEINSTPDKGTCIRLQLPLSVAIIQILLVVCNNEIVGIPLTRVLRTLEISRDQIRSSGRRMLIAFEQEALPLLSLRKMLHRPSGRYGKSLSVVVIEAQGHKIGLVVDRLVGQREAFVKSLAFPLSQIAGLSGATVLDDGRIIFVIDPQLLLDTRGSKPTTEGESR